MLVVNGSAGNDTFLLRKGLVAPAVEPLVGRLVPAAEKVTYTDGVNGGVLVNGLDGDDAFALDDNSSSMTIDGGNGNDIFQVGQLFTAYHQTAGLDESTVPSTDFADTTRGLLSKGVSNPTTINGGSGDDIFAVFRNVATLQLNGDAGDDTFIVRTFLLQSETTRVATGSGRDLVQYVLNAPVAIDGGEGYDTVIVVGTETADTFVVTADGIYGAGRYVSYVNIERLVVDGQEGDDTFYVQSTNPGVETRIVGGLGSDRIEVAGNAPSVQADDFLGYSGITLNTVESTTSPGWTNVPVDGVGAEIVDDDAPGLVWTPAAGSGAVTLCARTWPAGRSGRSGWPRPRARGRRSSSPSPRPRSTRPTRRRDRALELSLDGTTWQTTVTLSFSGTTWSRACRTSGPVPPTSLSSEGERSYVVQTRVVAITGGTRGSGSYAGLQVANTAVRVLDDDQVGVTTEVLPGGLHVVEGTTSGSTGATATYQVRLNRSPVAATSVRLTTDGQVKFTSPAATSNGTVLVLTFAAGSSTLVQSVTVWAPKDGVVEGSHFSYVTTSVSGDNVYTGTATGTSRSVNQLLVADAASLPNLRGYLVKIVAGRGAGQTRYVYNNDGQPASTSTATGTCCRTTTSQYVIVGYADPVAPPPSTTLLPGEVAGNVTAITDAGRTITLSGVVLPTDRGGLTGAQVRIVDGTGVQQYRTIASNTASSITVTSAWTTIASGGGSLPMAVGVRVAVVGHPGRPGLADDRRGRRRRHPRRGRGPERRHHAPLRGRHQRHLHGPAHAGARPRPSGSGSGRPRPRPRTASTRRRTRTRSAPGSSRSWPSAARPPGSAATRTGWYVDFTSANWSTGVRRHARRGGQHRRRGHAPSRPSPRSPAGPTWSRARSA